MLQVVKKRKAYRSGYRYLPSVSGPNLGVRPAASRRIREFRLSGAKTVYSLVLLVI